MFSRPCAPADFRGLRGVRLASARRSTRMQGVAEPTRFRCVAFACWKRVRVSLLRRAGSVAEADAEAARTRAEEGCRTCLRSAGARAVVVVKEVVAVLSARARERAAGPEARKAREEAVLARGSTEGLGMVLEAVLRVSAARVVEVASLQVASGGDGTEEVEMVEGAGSEEVTVVEGREASAQATVGPRAMRLCFGGASFAFSCSTSLQSAGGALVAGGDTAVSVLGGEGAGSAWPEATCSWRRKRNSRASSTDNWVSSRSTAPCSCDVSFLRLER